MPTFGIVLAGGLGTRLEAQLNESGKGASFVTPQIREANFGFPKPLMPIVRGKFPMLINGLAHLKASGVTNVTIVIKKGYEDLFKLIFGDGSAFGMKISFAAQEAPLGIPHAVKCAIDQMAGSIDMRNPNSKFIVVAGDNVYKGSDLTQIFSSFVSIPSARNSCVSLALPVTADDLRSKGHIQKTKDGQEQLKWGIQYEWTDDAGQKHVELVEKPLLKTHLENMQKKDCKAFALTAFYELSDREGPQGLLAKIEQDLRTIDPSKGIKEIFMPAILNRYIQNGEYEVGAPIMLENWVDLGDSVSLAANNFQDLDEAAKIEAFINSTLIQGRGCNPDEAKMLIKGYRQIIRNMTNVSTLYENGALAFRSRVESTIIDDAYLQQFKKEIEQYKAYKGNKNDPEFKKLKATIKIKINEILKNLIDPARTHISINERFNVPGGCLNSVIKFIEDNWHDLSKFRDRDTIALKKEYEIVQSLKLSFESSLKKILAQNKIELPASTVVDNSSIRIMLGGVPKLRIDFIDGSGQRKALTFQTITPFKIDKDWKLVDSAEPDNIFKNPEQLRCSLNEFFAQRRSLISAFRERIGFSEKIGPTLASV